jgi:hypothetical protein
VSNHFGGTGFQIGRRNSRLNAGMTGVSSIDPFSHPDFSP